MVVRDAELNDIVFYEDSVRKTVLAERWQGTVDDGFPRKLVKDLID